MKDHSRRWLRHPPLAADRGCPPKHLLPVGREPMIFHPVKSWWAAGYGRSSSSPAAAHGRCRGASGAAVAISTATSPIVYQDTAGGIAQALGLAKDFARGDKMCVLLGDNIARRRHRAVRRKLRARQGRGARILLKQSFDPAALWRGAGESRARHAHLRKARKSRSVTTPSRHLLYDDRVFDVVSTLEAIRVAASWKSDVSNAYIDRGELGFDVLRAWTDAGTYDSLRLANERAGPAADRRVRRALPAGDQHRSGLARPAQADDARSCRRAQRP